MLKHLSTNLEILMSRENINSNELARKIGIPATTIKRIRSNEQANPTITTLLPISQYFSVSLTQLIGTEPLASAETHLAMKIPILSWVECIHYDLLDFTKLPKKIFTERTVSSKSFVLTLDDHDLEFFPKHCFLIIEPEKEPESGDYVIVGNIQHKVASIRKYIVEIDRIYLKSLMTGAGISIFNTENKILGVIIQYKVELK
jgi:transcriptional regulator with XRE-family HTH domain